MRSSEEIVSPKFDSGNKASDTVKPVIVFVDDEDNVLRGIRRQLRGQRTHWDMAFFSGGAPALDWMEQHHVDVVVSDMRMPGMDGATFLSRVQTQHPEVVRIVLSGFAEKEMILKTIGPSHLYLAKPCDQEIIVAAIDRALKLRKFVHSDALRRMVAGMPSLPSLPKVFYDIVREIDNELANIDSIAQHIAKDVGISSQLMRLTNSAYFSLPTKASTPRQALNLLGLENVKAVVLLAGVIEPLKNNPEAAGVLDTLSRRSLQLAIMAQQIARAEKYSTEKQEAAFCAGLLAHLGTVLMVIHNAAQFDESIRRIELEGKQISDAERSIFGTTHAELGAYLLGLWGFGDEILEAVAYHHRPSESGVTDPGGVMCVHVAQHLLRAGGYADLEDKNTQHSLDIAYLEQLGMEDHLPIWQTVYRDTAGDWPDA